MDIAAGRLGISSSPLRKYNQNHGSDGRFSSGGGTSGLGSEGSSTGSRAAAETLYKMAAKVEPDITRRMTNLAESQGFRLEGLKYRIKTTDSLTRKIDSDAKRLGLTPDVAAKSISDSVRYTGIIPAENYTRATQKAIGDLKAAGYKARVKNYWQSGDPYQGVNVALTSLDGHGVELQFHTEESFRMKEFINHPIYEKYRASTDNAERKSLWDEMVGNADSLPVPPDALSVPDLKMQSFETTVV